MADDSRLICINCGRVGPPPPPPYLSCCPERKTTTAASLLDRIAALEAAGRRHFPAWDAEARALLAGGTR